MSLPKSDGAATTTPSASGVGPGVPRGFFAQQRPGRPPSTTTTAAVKKSKESQCKKRSDDNLREFLRISDLKEALRRETILATLPRAEVGATMENAMCIPQLDYGKLRKNRRQNARGMTTTGRHHYFGYGFSHRPTVEPFYSKEKPDDLDVTLFVVPPPWETSTPAPPPPNDDEGVARDEDEGGEGGWVPSEEHLRLVPEYMQVEVVREERRMRLLMAFDPDTALWVEGFKWGYRGFMRDGVLVGIKRIVLIQRDENFGKSFLLGQSAEAKRCGSHRQIVQRSFPMMAELQEMAFARARKRAADEQRAKEERERDEQQNHIRIMQTLEMHSRGLPVPEWHSPSPWGAVGQDELDEMTRPWYGPGSATSSTALSSRPQRRARDNEDHDEQDDEEEARYRDEEDHSNVYESSMTRHDYVCMLRETLMDIQKGGQDYRAWLKRRSGDGPRPEGATEEPHHSGHRDQ